MIRPMSDKQRAFLSALYNDVAGPDNGPECALAFFEREPSSREASAEIDRLLAVKRTMPRAAAVAPAAAPRPADPMPEAGYYGVAYEGVLRFYRVAEGKGKWAGRRFLRRYHSDWTDRPSLAERKAVVAAILADPHAAQMVFARETVHCYRCGRRLTDAESRARGVGPDCAALLGVGTPTPAPVPSDAPRAYAYDDDEMPLESAVAP